MRTLPFVIALLVAIALPATTASGQSPALSASPPAIKRTPLQKADVPAGTYEVVTGTAEIAANTNIGRHSHPGIETGYVLEGELTLLVEGQPPQRLKPGDSYKIPERAIHDARSGDKPAKVLAVYIVEKGKPLASAAE
jgi:quercetin dioxygenase-like cupin family protein